VATVLVNGQEIDIGDARLNGIQAAQLAGIDIPRYCWHPGLTVVASCRMCLVESGRKDPKTGEIQLMPKLVPACQTPATDGTVFVTNSDKVKHARAMVEEDLLIDHPVDCPICDKAGECYLQDYYFEHGMPQRRADIRPFHSRKRPMGETVMLFVDRCVMCSRCVRFTREVSGTSELMVINRGAHEEIDIVPGFPLDNKLSGNVVDLCPVGALGDRDFLYEQRVWFMKSHDNVCANCSTGCSIHVDENQDRIYRLRPRENPHINQWWMCDDGRYGWKHVHDEHRVVEPRRKVGDAWRTADWMALPTEIDARLKQAGRLGAVLSPHLTVEEAYLLASYIKAVDAEAVFALGPVPVEGTDEKFPTGFTIRAEKCPNRRGVEEIVSRFNGDKVVTIDELADRVASGEIGAVWVSGGYHTDWVSAETAAKFADAKTLIVQDLFASPLMDLAHFQLPGAAFPEREGSYVNHAGRLQSFKWAIRPPAGVQLEGRLYWRMLGRSGMYNARSVLSELAGEIAYFAAAMEEVPDVGVDLKANQLATV
jgi:NADH-quinone oxidoreductase subunit G